MADRDSLLGSGTEERPDHLQLAAALRRRVLDGSGETEAALRQAVASRAAGGPPMDPPFDSLARQVGVAAQSVSDAQVMQVVATLGSQRAAFEIIIAAAVGAGLRRWDAGLRALDGATDAAE